MFSRLDDDERRPSVAGNIADTLERFLRIFLIVVAIGILVGAVVIIAIMDASSRSQGGRIFVAILAVVALGGVDAQYGRLVARRMSLSAGDFWRYRIRSLFLMLAAAVLLLGLALFLP